MKMKGGCGDMVRMVGREGGWEVGMVMGSGV